MYGTTRTLRRHSLFDKQTDVKEIFNFQYLTHDDTVSHMKNHARVMFIIRGPPYSGKTQLSQLLRHTYHESSYCSMIKALEMLNPKDDTSRLGSETIDILIAYCEKLVEEACISKKPTIIVQNTNMRKVEMAKYMQLAIEHDYIVIMISTMYKFYITPQVLASGENRLDIWYLKKRFEEWEDVHPYFTAWFISPNDSEYIRSMTLDKLKTLHKIKQFRSWIEIDNVTSYFQPRTNMCCLAGYSADADAMKKYYFSNDVQSVYGKSFPISILGFLITRSDIIAVAQIRKYMKSLVMEDSVKSKGHITSEASSLLVHYGRTTEFPQKGKLSNMIPQKGKLSNIIPQRKGSSGFLQKWRENEIIPAEMCRPIHLAQRGFDIFSVEKVSETFEEGLKLMCDSNGILKERYFDSRLYKLNDDLWFVNVAEKYCFSTIFTGFYV